ncbi:heat shock protein DnaJ domain protein [Magnetococcus marinus MC-1]|uniref:Heat shock protein DnaJ domain protein n=1 Tax=Magnetococcus marinus (strain ATCC BAA-1437 / JCM 17883 / MC-1) TaxID=156889 RepID=A0L6C7_MAGMM|nr:J domain-containing protein [Magnetococcus marinus]ABK43520.1 heat shock protein DnaJ domain protein [Magnetococcus marinus MC-1]
MREPAPGLYARISAARELLGLSERASLADIETRTKALLKRWHPDKNPPEKAAQCHSQTKAILEAHALIKSYIAHYQYAFSKQEVERYLPPDEWWFKRFGPDEHDV